MFAALVAGRPVQSDFQQIDNKKCVCNLQAFDEITNLVVFMTGQILFPDGLGGAVYLGVPSNNELAWLYLGFITNEKPSAIFKISHLKTITGGDNPFFGHSGPMSASGCVIAQLGISIETHTDLAQLTPAEGTKLSQLDTFSQFGQYMLQNFVDYLGSFAFGDGQVIPLQAVQKWSDTFQRKMSQDPYFWKR